MCLSIDSADEVDLDLNLIKGRGGSLPREKIEGAIERFVPRLGCTSAVPAICLSELSGGERVRVLSACGHGFHGACVDDWLAARASCPTFHTGIARIARRVGSPKLARRRAGMARQIASSDNTESVGTEF
jgi:hypothetical protein